MRIRTALTAVAMLLTAASIASCVALAAGPPKATVQALSEGLTCQCGCGLTVANCNHPSCGFSVPLRKQIEAMLRTGMTQPEIIAFFRHKYGEKVLSAPTVEGFNILAWTAPFGAIFAGLILLLIVFGRWRSAPRAPSLSPASGPAPEYDPRLKQILERELKERI